MTLRSQAAVLVAVTAAATAIVAALPGSASASTVTAWRAERVCARPAPGHRSCLALRLVKVQVPAGSRAAARTVVRPRALTGPAGGFSPNGLAKAYGVNLSTVSDQTVAIVDAFNDPTVRSDLNAFDHHYGLPPDTKTSLRVVNGAGHTSPLPPNRPGWAGEITLDVQAVRGLCHTCKILLVETSQATMVSLARGVNEAVWMGAKIVSNSYGGPETDPSDTASVDAAYNHPGVAILASSGDDGWYDWDNVNAKRQASHVSDTPASLSTVIGVGGTSLYVNPDGTRAGEQVWNSNGPSDSIGNPNYGTGAAMGAAGSGCSVRHGARSWQAHVTGYSSLGCAAGKRSEVDIAAVADPYTGLDVYQTYPYRSGAWGTAGGTSLASPVVAALWALAGGPAGVTYPSLTLYGHIASTPASTYDVTIGGTGFCGTSTPRSCASAFGAPNVIGLGRVDCSSPPRSRVVLTNRYQCAAEPGYDGVSGVGTPNGLTGFEPMAPTAAPAVVGGVTSGSDASFNGTDSTDPFPGGTIKSYAWTWGDGTASTGPTVTHKYVDAGTYQVQLTVTDNYLRSGSATIPVTAG